jgi:hypothetical protein
MDNEYVGKACIMAVSYNCFCPGHVLHDAPVLLLLLCAFNLFPKIAFSLSIYSDAMNDVGHKM